MSTKDRILDEALTLFAENGYDGTGVEQIAEKVGIKAPSLYKHYEQHIGKIPESREDFVRVTMERILFTMRDPMIRKIRKFLVQEQFRSDRLAAITTRHQLEGVQKMYTRIIEGMMEKGLFVVGADPDGAYWADCGTLESYLEAHSALDPDRFEENPNVLFPGVKLLDSADLAGCVVTGGLVGGAFERAALVGVDQIGEKRLAALARRVFTRDRLVMCVTDNAPAAWAAQLAATLPSGAMGARVAYRPFPRRNEGFRISAGIGFAARVAHPAERLYSGSAVVAARILTLNHLWQEIRVKGGAYGGNFGVRRNGDAGWLSWNDPKPGRSLGVYSGSGDALRAFADGAEAIDRYVIGAVAVTEPYLSASAEMGLAMERHLNGVTAADLQRLRDEMLKTTKADLRAFAAKVDAVAADATVCVLGGAEPIKTCAGQLDVVEDVAEVKNAGK